MTILIPTGIYYHSIQGPGSLYAPVLLSLGLGVALGVTCQNNRICTSGAVRDLILMKNGERMIPVVLFFLIMLIYNVTFGRFHGGFAGQPIAHTEYVWNFLALYAVGFAAVLADGCPLRQLTLLGQGSFNAVMTFMGFLAGAALMHRLNLSASSQGVPMDGKIILLGAIVFLFIIAFYKSRRIAKE
jgi:YedE family putative selenium metabolism protein